MAIYNTNIVPAAPNRRLPSGLLTTGDLTYAVGTLDLSTGLAVDDVINICSIPENALVVPFLCHATSDTMSTALAMTLSDDIPGDDGNAVDGKYGSWSIQKGDNQAASTPYDGVKTARTGTVRGKVTAARSATAGEKVTFWIAYLLQS